MLKTTGAYGNVLKAARERMRLSTRDVEEATGISYAAVSRYETEGLIPSFPYMVLMCDLYGVRVHDVADAVRSARRGRGPSGSAGFRQEVGGRSIGGILSSARERAGLTTRDVHEATGISHASVSRYERNLVMPSFTNVVLMCDAYGLDLGALAELIRR